MLVRLQPHQQIAPMVKLVVTAALGAVACNRRIGSSPIWGTKSNVMAYRKLYDREELDLIPYVREYLERNQNVEILIGCDSQNYSDYTTYAIVVALYRPGRGAHVLFNRWKTKKEKITSTRLLNEVWYAVEVAEELRQAEIQKVKYIDIDINPDPKFKSNEVLRQAVGLVEGMGYSVRYKTLGPVVTYAADHLVKV